MDHESRALRDPGLTILGRKAAHEYSPKLIQLLEKNGFDLDDTIVGASPLRRAQETAHALFPEKTIHIFGELNEHGYIPENIPKCTTSSRKGWNPFLNMLSKKYSSDKKSLTVIAVGHRTFFRKEVLKPLGKDRPMNNMDAAILEYDCDTKKSAFIRHIVYDKVIPISGDRYIESKKSGHGSMVRRNQKGGNLPHAFFQDGAQMYGRSDVPTGVGLGATSDMWAREPISQRGGSCKCQRGGFPAGIMGSFVQNGLSLIPAAGYMLYRSQKKNTRRKRTRTNKTQKRKSRI